MSVVDVIRSDDSPTEDKIRAVREAALPLIGTTIERFETAEHLYEGEWGDWHDLPIRIYCSGGKMLSVSWSRFAVLWLANDESVPFEIDESKTRWKVNDLDHIKEIVGRKIQAVWLGQEQICLDSDEKAVRALSCARPF